jgi:hypothetical protein
MRTQIAEHFREKFLYQPRYLASGVKRAEVPNIVNGWPAHKDVPS